MVYIALEGLKGAGKTTAIEYVSAVLKQRRITPAILAPTRPMPDDVWWERAYAHFGSEDAFREALYAARSNYHASKINRHAPLILGDRSIITSLAIRWHQDADKERRIKHVRQSEYLIPMPDWVIQLDVSDEELLRRYHSRNRCYGTDEENLASIRQIRSNYCQLRHYLTTQSDKPQWQVLDCTHHSRDETGQQLADMVVHILASTQSTSSGCVEVGI